MEKSTSSWMIRGLWRMRTFRSLNSEDSNDLHKDDEQRICHRLLQGFVVCVRLPTILQPRKPLMLRFMWNHRLLQKNFENLCTMHITYMTISFISTTWVDQILW